MKSIKYALLPLFLFAMPSVKAQTFKNEFGFSSDNDAYLFMGQDRYYTNGLFINFRHALNQQLLSEKMEKKTFEIAIGQEMYNPRSGYAPNPSTQDRPFAGYLFTKGVMSWFKKDEQAWKAGLQVGTTGPSSLAQKGQELLHSVVGFYDPEGWEYQIKDELSLNLSAQYIKLLQRSANQQTDFTFEGYARAGTTFSGAGAGILFRAGKINQLFNTAYYHAQIENNATTLKLVDKEVFFYAKPQINVVAYDATIQGSMFNHNSPITFDVKPIVFAQQLGFNYSSSRFSADFGLLFKTKEVKSAARAHQYGTISLFYRFN
ncbi:lipid A deacylase LpxR family protein [Pedobacter sp.]|uniref:lipid A deacylase LpxR family protein n=1 Tax=Pedobacter sp. TaxID=1411316 RepID=UPI003D7FF5C7